MKKYLFLAAAITLMVGCADDNYVGDNGYVGLEDDSNAINFGLSLQKTTRADIMGSAAAELLGNNFYVTGTKGTEAATSPTPTLVFDNYLVHYGINTAGTTTSNTANWEYVGVTPGTSPYENYDKLSALNSQTIKYWDYNADQYDFLAFSTATFKARKTTTPAADEVGVTAMKYGTDLASSGVAYTFYLPSETALRNVYISDITEVKKANYGKEVTLKFKSLGSKIRVGLYETIPGYSVKDVKFYTVDGTTDFNGAKGSDAALIFAESGALALKGQIQVYFPHVGNNNSPEAESPNTPKEDYDIAAATVTPGSESSDKTTSKTFGALKLVADEADEAVQGIYYLGRSLPKVSFAGDEANKFYTNVFPVSTNAPITLRVDYTLVPIDGAAETITVKGAKAVVPATYTKWLPNYAYTYIFKISDNTNGWTGTGSQPSGLFPITFDAVVAEATDAQGEQTTVTTVSTPSITTYQQGHTYESNEYVIGTKKLYVRVMDNRAVPATPVGATACTLPALSSTTSLLYAVSDANATEAQVMDALENRTTELAAANVTGRNGVTLTKDATNITSPVTTIVNGVDDNPISLTEATDGHAAEITINSLSAGTYAYVYDYTASSKNVTTIYQPIAVTVDSEVGSKITGTEKNCISKGALDLLTDASNFTADEGGVPGKGEAVSDSYIYFSKTKNGTSNWTYSFVSVDDKTRVPAGLLKVDVTTLENATSTTTAVEGTFYFTIYKRNDGQYAVKVIKVVA